MQPAFTVLLLVALTITGAGLISVSAPGAAAAPLRQGNQAIHTVNLQLILDLSGSMARDIGGGETRMDAAKRVMTDVINALPEREGVNVGFRIYGHLGDNTEAQKQVSCQSSDLVVPMKGVDKKALLAQVAAARPIGWTPIALSLQKAGGDFKGGPDVANHILLVTDGEETCGGDPCAVAASLKTGDAAITTHVVGFALTAEQSSLINCIAEKGGGLNLRAANARELSDAIFSVLQQIQIVVQNGFLEMEEIGGLFPRATIAFMPTGDQTPRQPITLSNDNRVELPPGIYNVSWTYETGDEVAIRVNIEAGRTTWVRGSLLIFPQGAGEIYVVKDLAGRRVWQAPFEEGDTVWVLPGIYTMDLLERVGNPVLIMAQVQTLPGTTTHVEVATSP
jgi:hypothetical protein